MQNLLDDYVTLVNKRIPATNDWDDELNEISYLRQLIHEDIDRLDQQRLRQIDQKWQAQILESRSDDFAYSYPRETMDKSLWWVWIDVLDTLTQAQRATL